MESTVKKRLLTAINKVTPISDYDQNDCIFSQKYGFLPVTVVYILKQLESEFCFTLTDDFIDALEMCTFAQLEALLEEYSGKTAA